MARTWIIVGLAAVFWASSARAGLGQGEASVESDRAAISGVRRASVVRGSYTVYEIANDHLTIREYASNGVVFAVSWAGMRQPDLRGLLGTYFRDYEEASRASSKVKGKRSSRTLRGQSVVVEKAGHLRWARGKAYVPGLMPAGVTTDEIL